MVWYNRARFCPLCATELKRVLVEQRDRLSCSGCGFVLFEGPAAAAAGVVIDEHGRVLLIRRAIEPFRGDWALPAGYQERDESAQEALRREVWEETGLNIEVLELFDVLFIPNDPRKPANVAVYLCRAVGGELRAGHDASEAAWFSLDKLPGKLAFDNWERILSRLPASAGYRRVAGAAGFVPRGQGLTYKAAGVNIEAANEALRRSRNAIRASFTPGVLGDIGSFGGLFDLSAMDAGQGILVASTDGVGTKLELGRLAGSYAGLGRDLVHHCINDILVQGARPLFFLDYVGTAHLDPTVVSALICGCAEACRQNQIALLGGETAEMPGLYAPGDFDLVGFIIGVVERDKLLDGSRVRAGQRLIGLRSAGLHTNGYSLARRIVFDRLRMSLDDRPVELGGRTLGEALLAEHRNYYPLLWPLLQENRLAAMAHITGGGIVDNLPRVLGSCDARISRKAWEPPGLFQLLCKGGDLSLAESDRAFNMGIGMILIVEEGDSAAVCEHLARQGEEVFLLGGLVPAAEGPGRVRWIED